MAEKQASTMAKIRIGALIALGAIVLWFLVVNLFTDCEISFWPFTGQQKFPSTFFIVLWLAIGFGAGFGACYVWLRRKNLGKALDILADKESGKADDGGQKPKALADEGAGADSGAGSDPATGA